MKQQYEVKLELFEGPLDLLLYLVTKDEIDISQISVSRITEQYLEYLDVMRELNIDVASEYLHMASTLVRLKARELLPPPPDEVITSEEGIYSREQLIAQLLEYKKYKEAARSLRTFEVQQAGSFGRGSDDAFDPVETGTVYIGNISIFDLVSAYRRMLQKATEEGPNHVVRIENVRIDDRIERVLTVLADKNEVPFEELFMDDTRRIVLVMTFMAILELVKMQEITFRQEEGFGRIFVGRRDPATREVLTDPELEEGIEPEHDSQTPAPEKGGE